MTNVVTIPVELNIQWSAERNVGLGSQGYRVRVPKDEIELTYKVTVPLNNGFVLVEAVGGIPSIVRIGEVGVRELVKSKDLLDVLEERRQISFEGENDAS